MNKSNQQFLNELEQRLPNFTQDEFTILANLIIKHQERIQKVIQTLNPETHYWMNLTRNIKSTINQRKELLDRNRNNYLILELENGESILVFSGKVNQDKWDWLTEKKEINFTVEEGKNGANLLVDYVIET